MRVRPVVVTILFAAMAASTLAPPAAPQATPTSLFAASDPCDFYRHRAWGQGIGHYTMEMSWACEAIATRRRASVPLGERLEAMAVALERFRAGFAEAAGAGDRDMYRLQMRHVRMSPEAQLALAEETGVMSALAAIQSGF